MSNPDFKSITKRIIRVAMVKHNLTYADLVTKLLEQGYEEKEGALRNKVSRGTFSAECLVKILWVIGEKTIDLSDFDL